MSCTSTNSLTPIDSSSYSLENGSIINTSNPNKLLMIPGPIEFDKDVLNIQSMPSLSHLDPVFVAEFSETLKMTRQILRSKDAQPVIVAGGGSIGWDMIAANLVEREDTVLVLNTGYFADSFADCCRLYGNVVEIKAPKVGAIVDFKELEEILKTQKFRLICITQVDTSTAILNPIEEYSKIIKSIQPEAFIAVDGVCSFGSEVFKFDEWGIDAAMTASQKGFGAPPGLSISLYSQRAVNFAMNERKSPIYNYYCSFKNWIPTLKAYENKTNSYFSTPPVNLIRSLHVSFKKLLHYDIDKMWHINQIYSRAFKHALHALHLDLVSDLNHSSNALSAIYLPSNIELSALVQKFSAHGCIIAGGLHKEIKTKYFRIGHMGLISVGNQTKNLHLLFVLNVLEKVLEELGHSFERGVAVRAFEEYVNKNL